MYVGHVPSLIAHLSRTPVRPSRAAPAPAPAGRRTACQCLVGCGIPVPPRPGMGSVPRLPARPPPVTLHVSSPQATFCFLVQGNDAYLRLTFAHPLGNTTRRAAISRNSDAVASRLRVPHSAYSGSRRVRHLLPYDPAVARAGSGRPVCKGVAAARRSRQALRSLPCSFSANGLALRASACVISLRL